MAIGYFGAEARVSHLSGNLPHWRQEGVTYFVTFRLADSLPQERLAEWCAEREAWMHAHPEPHDEATRRNYYERFPHRFQEWLDAGAGSCVLAVPEVKRLVEGALHHFHGKRYDLDAFVVAPNHVHVIVTPRPSHDLSQVLHSWKSFTAHEIQKTEAASRRLQEVQVWQKESFDHIVRSPESLERFRLYIRAHQYTTASATD